MADKRMFSNNIIDSDKFLNMPLSAQALYFHMGMQADDEGFINNSMKIRRAIGASDDDMQNLIDNEYIIVFESGIVVITHWMANNNLRNDRCKSTKYQKEKNMLQYNEDEETYSLKEDGQKSKENQWLQNDNQMTTNCQPNDNQMTTNCQPSIVEYSIDKYSIDERVSKDTLRQTDLSDIQRVTEKWNSLSKYGIPQISKMGSNSKRHKAITARIREYGMDKVIAAIERIGQSDFLQGNNNNGWTITFDWFCKPSNFPKVLEGNYDNKHDPPRKHNGFNDFEQRKQQKLDEFFIDEVARMAEGVTADADG